MTSVWDLPDFDHHEGVHAFTDRESGLRAIIAVHSTHLGPAAGGARFWHYASGDLAVTDALRLSRGMSFKNAMAGLALGGGKGAAVERISAAALETLSIVAYRQPVTKAEVEAIRGVQAGPVLRALVDRGLVKVTGRAEREISAWGGLLGWIEETRVPRRKLSAVVRKKQREKAEPA